MADGAYNTTRSKEGKFDDPYYHLVSIDDVDPEVEALINVWIGLSIYAGGSVLINFGLNCVKRHFNTWSEVPQEERSSWYQWLWLTGWAIFFLGNLIHFFAVMYASQSLCAALGTVEFIANLAFSRILNHEVVSSTAVGSTALIVIGNVLMVIFGPRESQAYSLNDLLHFLWHAPALVYLSCIIVGVMGFQGLHVYLEKVQSSPTKRLRNWMKRLLPLSFAMVSVMIGTNALIIRKCIAGLVRASLEHNGELRRYQVYVIAFGLLVFAAFWLYRLNTALKLYDAMFIIPLQTMQVLWITFGVLGGGIFFEEFNTLSGWRLCLFALGVLIILIGVAVLTPSKETPSSPDLEQLLGDIEMDEIIELEDNQNSHRADALDEDGMEIDCDLCDSESNHAVEGDEEEVLSGTR